MVSRGGKSNSSGNEPDLSTAECFFAEGNQGVNYFRGAWHHPLLVLQERQKFLVVDRQGGGCNLNEFSIENMDLKIDLESIKIQFQILIKSRDNLLCS